MPAQDGVRSDLLKAIRDGENNKICLSQQSIYKNMEETFKLQETNAYIWTRSLVWRNRN